MLWFYKKFYWRSCFYLVLFGQVKGNVGKFGGYLGKNGSWSALIWKHTPNTKRNSIVFVFLFLFIFLEVIFFRLFFGQVCGNLGKSPSYLQKFACSYAYAQTGWPYWHVIFVVLSFVISGFCLLLGWMLFLAESFSSLWKCFFSVRYTVFFIS